MRRACVCGLFTGRSPVLARLNRGRSRFAQTRRSRRDALLASGAQRWIIHCDFAGTTSVPLRPFFWRDLLVRSAAQLWTIHSASAGVTSTPLQTGTINVRLRVAPTFLKNPMPAYWVSSATQESDHCVVRFFLPKPPHRSPDHTLERAGHFPGPGERRSSAAISGALR
jgi:hypothetical protein